MPSEIERMIRGAAQSRGVIGLGGGLPSPKQFPRAPLVEALAEVVQQPMLDPLQYAWPEGSEALREQIAALVEARGLRVRPERILVTSGAQQALAIAAQLACPRGAAVLVDPESYPGALELFRSRKLPLLPLSAEDALPKAAAAYVMPALANPRGGSMDREARERLLSSGLAILEDDAYGDLRFDGPGPRALSADAPDRGWFIGTFSKTLAPGLRVGWLVPPEKHLEKAQDLKRNADLQSNGLGQAIVERYLQRYSFGERLRKLRAFYARRARTLLAALRKALPGWTVHAPQGGFALWCEPDEPIKGGELAFLREAIRCGVSFDPGSQFRFDRSPQPLALRLCFSLLEPPQLVEGARRLAQAAARLSTGRRGSR